MLMMLAFVGNAWGAESLTQSIQASGPYKVYNLVWVNDGSGDFTATELNQPIDGIVMLVEFIPSTTAIPSAVYTVTLKAETSEIDILGGEGADLSTTVASKSQPLLNGNFGAIPVMGALTVDVVSAGNDKGGTVRIHYLSIN